MPTLTHHHLTDQGRALLASVAAGELVPSQEAAFLSVIGTLGKVTKVDRWLATITLDELSARIAALEERHAKT